MSGREDTRTGRPDAPESAQAALLRAAEHGRRAAAETLRALEALLDAASLASSGSAADANAILGPAAVLLGGLAGDLDPRDPGGSESLLATVAEALDAEVKRWEERAGEDPDARAVLRAFLGLRELLWEVGVRTRAEAEASEDPAPRRRRRKTRPRVQRVPIER